jgi:hypothetical protein
MRRQFSICALAFVLLGAVLQRCAAAGILFGTYTPQTTDGYYTNMNYWLGQANSGNGPSQSLRIIEVGWAAPDSKTGKVPGIDDTRNTWGWSGAVPILTWMPYGYKTWESPTPNDDITSGLYDDYIDAFLSQLSSKYIYEDPTAKRVYLRFAPAPNGNWFPWSPYCPGCSSTGQSINQTAASYVSLWKYVMKKVRDEKYNLTQDVLQVIFDVATASLSGPISSFAPPDELVDWYSITGINWGNTLPGNSWVTPSELFGPSLTALRAINATKPTGLASAGSTSQPNGVAAKSAWLTTLCTYLQDQSLMMYSYHNADSSTDVAIFGGSVGPKVFQSPVQNQSFKMYPEYRDCVAGSAFVGHNISNDRYLTDAQFQGL